MAQQSIAHSAITRTNYVNYQNRLANIEVQASGDLFKLPGGGAAALAVGAGRRSERYSDLQTNAERNLNYIFAEFRAPLVPESKARIGLQQLEFVASGRYEDYSDFGKSTVPTLGMQYVPITQITVRASWGRSFRAPDLLDEYGPTQIYVLSSVPFGVTSPVGTQVMLNGGSNGTLRPETSRSWTAGIDFRLESVPQFVASATYFQIRYQDRIATPIPNVYSALTNPVFAQFVVPNPSAALQQSLVRDAGTFGDFTGGQYRPASVVALVNDDIQNVESQQLHGVDASINYGTKLSFGEVTETLNASWLHSTETLYPGAAVQELAGVVFNPPKFRARAGITFVRSRWSATAFLNYIGSEDDRSKVTAVHVSSWTTADAQITFQLPETARFGEGARFALSSQNVFDRDPPHVGGASTSLANLGYDAANASPLGRFLSLTVSKRW